MATIDITTALAIPGLEPTLTKDDLKECTIIYIITKHRQLGKFSFHLVHRHEPITGDAIRLESSLGILNGKWNKTVLIDSINLGNIHGVVFKFFSAENRFVPYEFAQGPSPIRSGDVDGVFLQEFTSYLIGHNLANILALDIVHSGPDGQADECTADIGVDRLGTVILPKTAVNAREFLPTGWPGLLQPDDSNPPAGQAWANKVDEFHKVFINKPIGTARELVDELVSPGCAYA
ncbi:hypothetical protein J3458_002640 [Metarhizium acridum]|uniref:uncharacterized protein n=1 Tax=Metarhizium acridum TaxID=92637 RepID=UPI001C6AA2E0|nr:hypothetical protein J3458_002640 [Metarhizium acridum]